MAATEARSLKPAYQHRAEHFSEVVFFVLVQRFCNFARRGSQLGQKRWARPGQQQFPVLSQKQRSLDCRENDASFYFLLVFRVLPEGGILKEGIETGMRTLLVLQHACLTNSLRSCCPQNPMYGWRGQMSGRAKIAVLMKKWKRSLFRMQSPLECSND